MTFCQLPTGNIVDVLEVFHPSERKGEPEDQHVL